MKNISKISRTVNLATATQLSTVNCQQNDTRKIFLNLFNVNNNETINISEKSTIKTPEKMLLVCSMLIMISLDSNMPEICSKLQIETLGIRVKYAQS